MLPVVYFPALRRLGADVPTHFAAELSAEHQHQDQQSAQLRRSDAIRAAGRPAFTRSACRQLPFATIEA